MFKLDEKNSQIFCIDPDSKKIKHTFKQYETIDTPVKQNCNKCKKKCRITFNRYNANIELEL
jgi:hypothetical protein